MDIPDDMNSTKRHCLGVARPKPIPWVTMMPITMASCARTPNETVRERIAERVTEVSRASILLLEDGVFDYCWPYGAVLLISSLCEW
ncbi:hypothetical protein CY34DRAFT_806711 [Suillus luteus UH-Slu-Lm8-n1]|uniref:Uncharacterized protein n=1 Tax=Suillus luteus UH-Slu-Lm8-n1 TaxID=930992 RepID=A0A0D0BBP6_9AGAM|nr:hypothetical protein CY34DRAFT_806711 [Suillus luteus UH-Slu-Lm8-n1]